MSNRRSFAHGAMQQVGLQLLVVDLYLTKPVPNDPL